MGEPYFKAKDIIIKNKVEVFSSNYSLYGDLSRRVMRTLKRFNSDMEIYSIDEAFLDLSNFPDQDVEKVGKEIRDTVLQWTGIPTSIGIAKNYFWVDGLSKEEVVECYEEIVTCPKDSLCLVDPVGKTCGALLRCTKYADAPIYISNGHKCSL